MKRVDKTGFGNLVLVQDDDQFCYGVDAVILADFAHLNRSDIVCDFCSGNGIIPLILAHKYHCESITAVELQKEVCELAAESFGLNEAEIAELGSSITLINSDIKKLHETDAEVSRVLFEHFSAITCNPPYFQGGSGIEGAGSIKHTARFETKATLEDFIAAAEYMLKSRGRFFLVHRPERLVDILVLLRAHHLEPKRLRMVCGSEGSVPRQVLVEAVKGGGKDLKVEPILVVHGSQNGYSPEIQSIYERDAVGAEC